MFNLGGGEILVILVVALLVLGPEKLPRFMRTVGKAVGDLRRASTDFQRTMNLELAEKEIGTEEKKPDTEAPEPASSESAELRKEPDGTDDAPEELQSDPASSPRHKTRLRAVPPRRTPRRGTGA